MLPLPVVIAPGLRTPLPDSQLALYLVRISAVSPLFKAEKPLSDGFRSYS